MSVREIHVAGILTLLLALTVSPARARTSEIETGGFRVDHEMVLPGTPGEIYDAITGDVSGWWDHSMSANPKKFFIEARPGGGFYEIFNDRGDGVRHAVVIYADRGKLLRFEGPLGLSGYAIHMVHTIEFAAEGTDRTRLHLTVRAAGEIQDGWAEAVDRTWHHFLVERFKPYVESGMKPLPRELR